MTTNKFHLFKEEQEAKRITSNLYDPMTTKGTWSIAATRYVAGIDQHQLAEPETLVGPDSCFSDINGVKIHYQVRDSDDDKTKRQLPMLLLHGLGSSIFTWSKVMKPLSEISSSKVLAFDRPGFGFTSRTMNPNPELKGPMNPYSMAYSVLSTLFFVNYLGTEKIILVGHSFGGLVALNAYFRAPERIGALILVDPSIIAPFSFSLIPLKRLSEKFVHRYILNVLTWTYNFITETIIRRIVNRSARVLAAILRSSFGVLLARLAVNIVGVAIVKFAWHDKSRVSEQTISGYTKPLRCKGWDRGAVEFLAATILDLTGQGSKPELWKRLSDISCPVLIITGDDDWIVPSWNSKRLSRAIPGSVFEVIKQCGHFPQEEKEQEFVSVVQRFLQTVDISL